MSTRLINYIRDNPKCDLLDIVYEFGPKIGFDETMQAICSLIKEDKIERRHVKGNIYGYFVKTIKQKLL